jgi:hypothetical protein
VAFNPNQPRDPHGRFGEVAAHAAAAIANVVSATGNAATVARAISAVLKTPKIATKSLDLTKFHSYSPVYHSGSSGVAAWLSKMSKEWLGGAKLYPGVREDVQKYSDESSVNGILRGLQKIDIEESDIHTATAIHNSHVTGLDEAIVGSEATHDVHLYRGVGTPSRYGLPGTIFHDLGFVSTSFDQNKAASFSKNKPGGGIAHIYLRKGLKALVLNGLSEHQSEAEVLLPRNSKFRVLHYSEEGKHVHLEALGDGGDEGDE